MDDQSLKRLTRGQTLVLVMVALLAAAAFSFMEGMVRANAGSAAQVNVSGRQRMLTQRIAYLAERIAHEEGERDQLSDQLREALHQMRGDHGDLIRGNAARGLPATLSEELNALYHGPAAQVDAMVDAFLEQAGRVAAGQGGEETLKQLRTMAQGELPRALDRVVAQIQRESEYRIMLLERGHFVTLFSLLAILVFSALTIFRPLIARVREEAMRRAAHARALEAAKEEAEKANRAKSEFLSSMSHELRTPMNAILGFGQILISDPGEPLSPTQQEEVREILKAGDYLLFLINEVLDLARVEAGKVLLSIEPIAVREVLDEALSLGRSLAERRGITLVDRVALDLPWLIIADFTRLKQVLLNLISNAVKYNLHEGRIFIDCQVREGGSLRLGVADTGPGIPVEKHGEVFKPFSRLGAENTQVEGTGIGLTITKQLVELMGGTIGFANRAEGGALFWVEFPLAPEDQRTQPRGMEGSFATAISLEEAAARPCLVLYVEDNPANLRLMERIIERIPRVQLISAPNAEMGIELAMARRPHLIIMDIHLPGMDGYSALQRLRESPETCTIPVIALSAHAMSWDVERGLEAGFRRYLVKPVQVQQVLEAVREVSGEDSR